MDSSVQQFIEVVRPHLDVDPERCRNHPETPGQAVCPVCRELYCWRCMAWDDRQPGLLCGACLRARRTRRKAGLLVCWFRKPLFYVALLATLGVLFYLVERGSHSEEVTRAADSGKAWFRRRPGVVRVLQAKRARRRALQLVQQGRQSDAEDWYRLCASALGQADESFGQSPRKMDIAIGRASALGHAGKLETGVAELQALDRDIPEAEAIRVPYLYARAELLWRAGRKDAAKQDWAEIIRQTEPSTALFGIGIIDDTLEMMAGGLHEAAVTKYVRQACDTVPGSEIWRARTLAKLGDYGISRAELRLQSTSSNRGTEADTPGIKLERF